MALLLLLLLLLSRAARIRQEMNIYMSFADLFSLMYPLLIGPHQRLKNTTFEEVDEKDYETIATCLEERTPSKV